MTRHTKKRNVRRIGADMTNVLMYVGFAIVVLIGVLTTYQSVMMSQNKKAASELMIRLGAELEAIQRGPFSWTVEQDLARETTSMVMDRMNLEPSQRTVVEGQDGILLPYGGVVLSINIPYEGSPFSLAGNGIAFIIFPENTRNATALCNYLAAGPEGVLMNGPLGSEYAVMAKSCDGTVKAIQISYGAATSGFS